MPILLLVLLNAALSPPTPTYQLRLDIIRGADTASATIVLEAGIESRALLERPNAFTRLRAMVRPAPTTGCIVVSLGTANAPTREAAEQIPIEPVPLIQLCGVPTARVSVEGGPLIQVTVHEVAGST